MAAAGKDTITDFTAGDQIDLSLMDADGNGESGDTAFSSGTGGFTGQAGEVRVVDFGDGRQGVHLDTNGDQTPDSIINVYADHALGRGISSCSLAENRASTRAPVLLSGGCSAAQPREI